MIRLNYKDEDGPDSIEFKTKDECDRFISYNENRVKDFRDEKFEVISIEEIPSPNPLEPETLKDITPFTIKVDEAIKSFTKHGVDIIALKECEAFHKGLKYMSKFVSILISNNYTELEIREIINRVVSDTELK